MVYGYVVSLLQYVVCNECVKPCDAFGCTYAAKKKEEDVVQEMLHVVNLIQLCTHGVLH